MSEETEVREVRPIPATPCAACGEPMTTGRWVGGLVLYDHWKTCALIATLERDRHQSIVQTGLANGLLRASGLPKGGGMLEYAERFGWEGPHRRGLKAATLWLQRWAERQRMPDDGFTLCGPSGCGKSTLITAFGRTVCRDGGAVLFVHVPTLHQELTDGLKGEGRRWADRSKALREFDGLLILDDLGLEPTTAYYVEEFLYPTVWRRLEDGRATAATTTETVERLREIYGVGRNGAALVSRLEALCGWVQFPGTNQRRAEFRFAREAGQEEQA